MKNINWRFILINLLMVGISILALYHRRGGLYKIALGVLFPILIYSIVHYLILRKMLNMPFPFDPLMQKHKSRIKIAAKVSDWVYKGQEAPNWAKHNYAGTPYVFALITAMFSLLALVLGGLAINAYTPFDLKTIFDPRDVSITKLHFGVFTFLAGWYTLVLTSMLLWFSQTIFDKPRSITKKAVIIAGIAAFAAVMLYIIIISQVAPIKTIEALKATM